MNVNVSAKVAVQSFVTAVLALVFIVHPSVLATVHLTPAEVAAVVTLIPASAGWFKPETNPAPSATAAPADSAGGAA